MKSKCRNEQNIDQCLHQN